MAESRATEQGYDNNNEATSRLLITVKKEEAPARKLGWAGGRA